MAEPHVVASVERAAEAAPASEDAVLDGVVGVTLVALVVGLTTLTTGPLAWDRDTALPGIAGQLGETLPAAALVLAATALNLAAGAVLARLAVGRPLEGIASTLLAATVGAVLVDTAALLVLGGLGLFRGPVLLVLHVGILALGWVAGGRVRPLVRPGTASLGPPGLAWAIVGVLWFGAFALQLASPVVPFLDVLPNHVAPVERLRTFGDFATLTESPSPIYGPSRTFLGYIGWLGTITTLTGLPAGLAVSAFILPASILVAAGVHRLTTAVGGPGAGVWGLVTFALTASFGRLTDARATVVVLPLALGALAWLAARMAPVRGPDAGDDRADATNATARAVPAPSVREALVLGAALGAAVLVHPVVGALAVGTVGIVVLIRPGIAALGVPAVAVASALALPQAATMLGLAIPSAIGLAAVVPALLLGRLLTSARVGRIAVMAGRAALLGLVPLGLASADRLVRGATGGLTGLVETMPLLTIGAIAGLVLAPRMAGHPIVVAGLAAGAIVGVATQLVPQGGGLLTDSIRFELPKTLHYWLPVLAALATAIGLLALWRREGLSPALRAALLAVFLVVAAMPLRSEEVKDHHLGEHRLAETLAVNLRWAGSGYWRSYPDTRRVVDAPRAELLEVVRDEIEAGRLGAGTNLLHVAPSFQQWVATPFGVFTGVRETVVSPDGGQTIHTVGGRLRTPDQLPALLTEGTFRYVVVEPGTGVPDDARDRILAAGYESVFRNTQGEIFARP